MMKIGFAYCFAMKAAEAAGNNVSIFCLCLCGQLADGMFSVNTIVRIQEKYIFSRGCVHPCIPGYAKT